MTGRDISKLIKCMGITQSMFCKKYQFSRKSVYNWTHGKSKPGRGSIIRLKIIEQALSEFEEKVHGQRRND